MPKLEVLYATDLPQPLWADFISKYVLDVLKQTKVEAYKHVIIRRIIET